jgi:hypothetical protein
MTRDEAVKTLKDRIEQYTGGVHPGEREILIEAFAALRGSQPDPKTGLARCGCGGKPYPHFQLGWYREDSDSQAFEVCIGCDECGLSTKPRRGLYAKGEDTDETEMKSKGDWNTAMGYHD